MSLEEFIGEWGPTPDGGNFLISMDQSEEREPLCVYLKIAQPRRGTIHELVVDGVTMHTHEIEKWIDESLTIIKQALWRNS